MGAGRLFEEGGAYFKFWPIGGALIRGFTVAYMKLLTCWDSLLDGKRGAGVPGSVENTGCGKQGV